MIRIKIFETNLLALTEFMTNNPDAVTLVVAEAPVSNATPSAKFIMADVSEETYQALIQSKIIVMPVI